MDTLVSMQVFRLVGELASFKEAASRLNMSPAMASKHVAHLEQRLSARLLNRTSRHVSLTELGVLYLDHSRQMLDALQEIEDEVSQASTTPTGILKISAPVWCANRSFADAIAQYLQRHPGVELDIDLSGRQVNLVDEGFDLALRVTNSLSEGLIAKTVTGIAFQAVASPEYLKHRGGFKDLDQLEGAEVLDYSMAPFSETLSRYVRHRGKAVQLKPVLRSTNETLLHQAAMAGMGIAFFPVCFVASDLMAGRLQAVLPEHLTFKGSLYAIYPSRKHLSAKVRTFIDFLPQCFAFTE